MLITQKIYVAAEMMNALIDLSGKTNKPVNVLDISERSGYSVSYIEQIFAPLRIANIVTGARGPGGGYRLVVKPDILSVGMIVDAFAHYLPDSASDLGLRLIKAIRDVPLKETSSC